MKRTRWGVMYSLLLLWVFAWLAPVANADFFPKDQSWSDSQKELTTDALNILEGMSRWSITAKAIKKYIYRKQITVDAEYISKADPDGNALALTTFPLFAGRHIYIHSALFLTKETFTEHLYSDELRISEAAKLASVLSHEMHHFYNPPNLFCMTHRCIEGPGYQKEREFFRDYFAQLSVELKSEKRHKILSAVYLGAQEREQEGYVIGVLEGERFFP